jgi:hypothetical protein
MLEDVVRRVQRNCDISDASHGGNFTMCTYLMKMREYFRWEKGLGFTDRLPKEELGEWLASREGYWEEIEREDFAPIEIDGRRFDPFDSKSVNTALREYGLVYSAGLENCAKPHFYLAELEREEEPLDGFSMRISGRELARGLNSPPAMLREETIFIRREALRRLLWERLETWRWNSPDNAMGRAFACYDMDEDVEAALYEMADNELLSVREHEIGEYLVGRQVGDAWNEMLLAVSGTPAELMARAVRDLAADCLRTLPAILEDRREKSLHFYVGNLGGMRKAIFPSLEQRYREWLDSGDAGGLHALVEQGQEHWLSLAQRMCELHAGDADSTAGKIKQLVESAHL